MQIPIQNVFYLLAYAWDQLEEAEALQVDCTAFDNAFALLAKVLANGTTHLLKRGLDRNYQEEETLTSQLRGKILFPASVKENTFARAAAYCAFDELSYDVLHNRLLKATFKRLAKEETLCPKIRQELHLILQRFPPEITPITVRPAVFRKIQLHRNNRQYKLLLSICELVWLRLLSTEQEGVHPFKDFLRDKKQMAYLFEKFLLNFYKRHLNREEWQVSAKQLSWQLTPVEDPSHSAYIPSMQTDISLISRHRHLVMDAKYYPKALKGQYDRDKIITNNLYQVFSYTQNITNAGGKQIEGILIYPEVSNSLSLSYKFTTGNNALIKICTVNLNQEWQDIESDLLKIV
ncbi:hypothetical protein TH63_13560 [Rufibacter radiotolerans]|uniref:5-methylcytosine-specific restriction enzyme subunit McrC n=1 Tax=Rufibacter radiotolerans TaxID=1379910 RepID=A0A0H4VM70_9BACT|nr:hypothetical protein [Rufibacter radiotolerans]AKQ46418.1 hypothetical protein TH63_13560 [Rufibacter radiotolerans]